MTHFFPTRRSADLDGGHLDPLPANARAGAANALQAGLVIALGVVMRQRDRSRHGIDRRDRADGPRAAAGAGAVAAILDRANRRAVGGETDVRTDRKSTRLNSSH